MPPQSYKKKEAREMSVVLWSYVRKKQHHFGNMSTKIGTILGWDMALWRALAYIRLWVQSLALKKVNRPKKKKNGQ